jgi:hypothetical protein
MNNLPMNQQSLPEIAFSCVPIRSLYYDVEEEPEQIVYILSVGVKEGNLVRIGTEVISP